MAARPARPEGAEYITAVNRLTKIFTHTDLLFNRDSPAIQDKVNEFQERFQVGLRVTLAFICTGGTLPTESVNYNLWHSPGPRSACRCIPEHIDKFMEALPQVSITGLLSEDTKVPECSICLRPFAEKSSIALSAANNEGKNQTDSMHVLSSETAESQSVDHIAVRLACGHVFGKDCIRAWLCEFVEGSPPTCPVCRFQLEGLGDAITIVNGLFYVETITVH